MDKYELVVIVDAANPQETKESILKETTDVINKSEGKVINSQVWLEKHKFSFPMKKRPEGTYYLINFESPRPSVIKIKQFLRQNENILRSLIARVE